MPIYEYTCQDCGKEFETIVSSIVGNHEVQCKFCGSNKTKKKLSVTTTFKISSAGGTAGLGSMSSGCSSRSGFS